MKAKVEVILRGIIIIRPIQGFPLDSNGSRADSDLSSEEDQEQTGAPSVNNLGLHRYQNDPGSQKNVCKYVCVCVSMCSSSPLNTCISVISIFFIFNLKNNLHKSLYSTILNQDIALALTHCTEKRKLKGIQKDK